jgi:prolyl-tRNA editing enzyme YbaK/EbsC (Cys-tRNA(Pro) deacylase)
MQLKDSAQRVQEILNQKGLDSRVIEFKELTRTAQEAAQAIGCEVGQIAKTLIFRGKKSHHPICVIASGVNRVDEKKIEILVGEEIEKPDADYVWAHTTFTIGGIPPIGFSFEMKPFLDRDLLAFQEVWAAAGTPYAVFCINILDLIKITQSQIADIKK